jgi:uroporphyrin-III C-methyltransferase
MIRRRIWEEDYAADLGLDAATEIEDEDIPAQKHTFNALVTSEDLDAARNRRMRWLSQICEYWPLKRLAAINDVDVDSILSAYSTPGVDSAPFESAVLDRRRKAGHITLAGSGPGNPDLLTRATHRAIQDADLILADKLVPAPVLDLVPRRTEVYIARKFPGNADKAQEELLSMGLEALKAGRRVLRLKQGDPYLYGRGAEEYDFFQKHGYTSSVLPGITSALSGPLFAGIPPTHRSVADQVLICTGTGRKGAVPDPPPYVPTQTVVFLMALHRLVSLVESLTIPPGADVRSNRVLWPKETPCAVVERASCPDQRVIRTTLEHVCTAVEDEGSRPPGLLIVGWSCQVIHKSGGQRWAVEEGFKGMEYLTDTNALATVEDSRSVASNS